MKELKKRIALTVLATAACSLAFVCTLSAIQAEPPAELPEELLPEWKKVQRDREAEAAETPVKVVAEVDKPEPVAEVEPQLTDLGEFKLTAYCTCGKCCGEWADGITYTGTEATPGRTIAVDPKVIQLGSTVVINGTEYIAEDIGGAIKGNRIDVLFPTHQEALEFGVQYADVHIKN